MDLKFYASLIGKRSFKVYSFFFSLNIFSNFNLQKTLKFRHFVLKLTLNWEIRHLHICGPQESKRAARQLSWGWMLTEHLNTPGTSLHSSPVSQGAGQKGRRPCADYQKEPDLLARKPFIWVSTFCLTQQSSQMPLVNGYRTSWRKCVIAPHLNALKWISEDVSWAITKNRVLEYISPEEKKKKWFTSLLSQGLWSVLPKQKVVKITTDFQDKSKQPNQISLNKDLTGRIRDPKHVVQLHQTPDGKVQYEAMEHANTIRTSIKRINQGWLQSIVFKPQIYLIP